MMFVRILRDPGAVEGGAATVEEVVSISRAELDALREAASRPSSGPVVESGREEALIRELSDREERLKERDAAYRSAVRDRELAVALAGRPLVSGATTQLLKLWRDEFDVTEDNGRCRVAACDGRTVSQVVTEWLSSPEYAHFCQPSSRGGTAVAGANRPATAQAAATPRTLGEVILRRWQDSSGRPDPASAPVGLGRRR